MRIGVTVSDFGSPLYSAPERRVGQFDERSDLYSLGVTTLKALVPHDFELRPDNLDTALYEADLPVPAQQFIRRLIASDPDERFARSSLALAELGSLVRRRPEERPDLTVYLRSTAQANSDLRVRLANRPGLTVERLIADDLDSDEAVELYRGKPPSRREEGESFVLYGSELSYHVVIDERDTCRLVVVHAFDQPYSLHEKLKERALPLRADLSFGPPFNRIGAGQDLLRLRALIAEHEQRRSLDELEREERGLFREWRDLLDLKRGLEKTREAPIDYSGIEPRGPREALVTTIQAMELDLIGQERYVRVGAQQIIIGAIVDVLGDGLLFRIQQGSSHDLPKRGQLKVNRTPSIIALEHQYRALDAVQYGRSVRSDLGALLVHPEAASRPTIGTVKPPHEANLDPPKRHAVATALGSPDLTVVEGPPGTGKTTFISELVCQYHDDQPSHRMLVSGQTHVAVDNAISRIALLDPSLTIVRVGRTERVGDEALGMTVDSQMTRWRERVVAASREYLARLAADEGIDASVADTFGLVEQLGAQEQERGRVGAEIERLAAEERSLEERLTDPETASREASGSSVVADLQDEFARVREALEDYEGQLKAVGAATERSRIEIARRLGLAKGSTVEEVRAELAARTGGASEGLERYRALQALQADWLQRFGKDEGFEKALLSTADVVAGTCLGIASVRSLEDLAFDVVIIDESSKATPTETLVPMSRGKRWILVGDPQQLPPFVDGALNEQGLLDDAGLTREQLRTTLFDRLLNLLPDENHLTLSVQHRMVRPIGDLVSACFYEGRLLSERVATSFRSLSEVLPAPVTWYSTSHLGSSRRERRSGHSFVNVEEAIRIRNWLGYLHLFAAQREENSDSRRALRVRSAGGAAAAGDPPSPRGVAASQDRRRVRGCFPRSGEGRRCVFDHPVESGWHVGVPGVRCPA